MGNIIDFQSQRRKKQFNNHKKNLNNYPKNMYIVIIAVLLLFFVVINYLKNFVKIPATYTLIGMNVFSGIF